jgi:opacity protein-like surface antigen
MRLKLFVGLAVAVFFVCAAYPALAQSTPTATGPKQYSPLAVGVGFNVFDPGWNNGQMDGGALWIDYLPNHLPQYLNGLGIEVLARDMSINKNPIQLKTQREDVASGGLIYAWPRYRKLRPYAKAEMGFGNFEYVTSINGKLDRNHQSRTVTIIGGGLDLRAFRNIWVRADYEYQFWPDFFKYTNNIMPARQLNPQGVTIGAEYRFGSGSR